MLHGIRDHAITVESHLTGRLSKMREAHDFQAYAAYLAMVCLTGARKLLLP